MNQTYFRKKCRYFRTKIDGRGILVFWDNPCFQSVDTFGLNLMGVESWYFWTIMFLKKRRYFRTKFYGRGTLVFLDNHFFEFKKHIGGPIFCLIGALINNRTIAELIDE